MRKELLILLLLTLSACAGSDKTISYPSGGNGSVGNPTNPSGPFVNSAVEENSKLTGILSRTDSQIVDYITYRLNKWNDYNPNTGEDISQVDIAEAAVWLTSGNRTVNEIEQYFADNLTLMHMVVYVVDNRLNSCFKSGGVNGAAQCFVRWRDTHPDEFNYISNDIYQNTFKLDASNALFEAANNMQLSFVVDEETGSITGIKLKNNSENTEYANRENNNEFYSILFQDGSFITQTLTYNSLGKELGLSYSDFGIYNVVDKYQDSGEVKQVIADNTPFAGGYSMHKVAEEDIKQNVDFSGVAVGVASSDSQVVDLKGEATLTFNSNTGGSTLGASFNNWYDVLVNTNGSIEFDNYKNADGLVKLQADTGDGKGPIVYSNAEMNVNYYAPMPATGVPTEATGLVHFQENGSNVKMDIAFGAK